MSIINGYLTIKDDNDYLECRMVIDPAKIHSTIVKVKLFCELNCHEINITESFLLNYKGNLLRGKISSETIYFKPIYGVKENDNLYLVFKFSGKDNEWNHYELPIKIKVNCKQEGYGGFSKFQEAVAYATAC